MSRLVEQVKQAMAAFSVCKTPPALIGGLALAAHRVVRATRVACVSERSSTEQ